MPPYRLSVTADQYIRYEDFIVKQIQISDSAYMHDRGMGGFIRERREALGLTQKGLASTAGVAQSAISDLERGHRSLSNADIRRRIAKALDIAHVDLLIAAGELTPEELPSSAVVAEQRAAYDPNQSDSDRFQAVLCSTVRRHTWAEQEAVAVIGFIRLIKGEPIDTPANLDALPSE